MGPSWSSFGASWARCWSIFPPGGRGRGGSRRSFLKLFLDVLAERPKKDNLAHMLMFISYIFLCYVLSPVAFLAAWPAAPHKCNNVENPLFFVGRKPYAPCSGNARSNQLSGGTRNKYRWKKELKKRTHGTRKQSRQKSIFETKMAFKMDPGGFQKRVHKTVGN